MRRTITNKFNRGEVDPRALARDDYIKVSNSGALMTNFMPQRLGPMTYRPGTEYLGAVADSCYLVPFVAAVDDTAILEFTNNQLRPWTSDAVISRTSVTSSITNGTFTSDISGWTDDSGAGSTTSWKTGGYASLKGSGTTKAVLYQTISATETGEEHGLTVVVAQAPVKIQIGTSGNGSFDVYQGTLGVGTHSLVFTPSSNITITFSNSLEYETLIDSVAFDGDGTLSFTTEIATADLPSIRPTQSADVVFTAFNGGQPMRIEQRGTKSWSLVEFRSDDGPFDKINNSDITLTPGALTGNTTLIASDSFFTSDHVGALFKLASLGQEVTENVSAEDNGTNSILVTGVGDARRFFYEITGTWSGTITLQRSADDSSWEDVDTYTTNSNNKYDDKLDNSDLYFRLRVKSGDYTSGTMELKLIYSGGSIEGIGRVTGYNSPTSVNVQVVKDFGKTNATRDWYEGMWSDEKGYPTAITLYEGRLWLAGKSNIYGSVSDAYDSFDTSIEGDSKSIQKTIGFGPNDAVQWLKPSTRLIMGLASDEIAVRSSSFGEILTANNTNLKSGSTQGSANLDPVNIDDTIVFAQRSGTRIYSLEYYLDRDVHSGVDLTLLHPSICSDGIKRIAVTRQPETRVYVVLDNGDARVYLFDKVEEVSGWSRIETDGNFEDVIVLPGLNDDRVYFVVNRTGGRYLEKLALFSEAEGGDTSKHFDSFKTYTSPGTTITGLSHLEGKSFAVCADAPDRGDFTVASGQITVGSSWTNVVVGLRHTADYVSNKLGQYVPRSVLTEPKRVVNTGLIMMNYWPGSLKIGPSVSLLSDLPDIEQGKAVDTTAVIEEYDEIPFEFDGVDDTDSRIYMRATGPCTILALTYGIEGIEPKKEDKD